MAKGIKRTRAVSHKKKKITAVQVKAEITKRKSSHLCTSPVASKKNRDDCGIDNRLALLSAQKKKGDLLYAVGNSKVNLSLRPDLDNYTMMIPQISKEINSNFNCKYRRRATVDRRSSRNLIDTTIHNTSDISQDRDIMLVDYTRCYVEDYMQCHIGEMILVLVPLYFEDKNITPWSELFGGTAKRCDITFTKQGYAGYIATVVTNPSLMKVNSGMHISDYIAGFGNHNYGCHLSFCPEMTLLLSWKSVIDGMIGGIQVWKKGNTYRNVFPNYRARIKTTRGIQALTNRLFTEVYGDRVQALHILDCHNRAIVTLQNKQIKDYESQILAVKPVLFEGDSYKQLLQTCNDSFDEAISLCYTDFVVIGGPIVTRHRIDKLVELYKSTMNNHYNTFYKMFGFDAKAGLAQNVFVAKSGYYDRLVFYNFLAMARQRNNKVMTSWAMISAGANYGRGIGDIVNRRAIFLGASTILRIFLRKVAPYGQSMEDNVTKTLSGVDKTVWTLDNNQLGHPLKHQRFGSSNDFVKVTGRTCRECIQNTIHIGDENEKRVTITYIDQAVINPIGFSIFEREVPDMVNIDSIRNALLRQELNTSTAVSIDMTGVRVGKYNELVRIASVLNKTIKPLLTGYIKTSKKYKVWNLQPTEYTNATRNMLSKILHSESEDFNHYSKFQNRVVQEWNPSSAKATAFIIPPVSLRDEIKTDGYGMAMIELLCLSGILLKSKRDINSAVDNASWTLSENWWKKTLYLCMDGLSLDRHRSFQRKLTNLPFSFDKAFKQCIIFQKAFSKVVEISGPLHIAFHMLQSIYIVYKDMMNWSQKVVEWKKVNTNKVSESFDTCRQLCMMTLEEIERLSIDLFITDNNDELEFICLDPTVTSKAISVAIMYNTYITSFSSTDQRRLYMHGFITMATEFRNYWAAVRCGDRITMEVIQNKWIGVHLLVGKHKCVENYLNSIDLEYKKVDNITLQEIRMNISCRYHIGCDKRGMPFPMHPLDEVQENVNLWTKRILLGSDEISWRVHSPNVAAAHMCVNHEETEYIKSTLDYSDLNNVKRNDNHRSKRGDVPTKTVEKTRLYEWCVGMFKDDIPGRECIVKDGYTIINALKTKFKQGNIVTKTDELESCINGMFNERDNTINVPVEDDSGTNDSECNDSEAVEIMIDDYTGHQAINSSDANTDDINHTIKDKNHRSIPKLSLKDVFAEGRLKMIEMNIPSMRERKKLREQRTNAFFLEIHDTVTQSNDNAIDELDSIHNDILFNPWYRMSYRLALG